VVPPIAWGDAGTGEVDIHAESRRSAG
jgi:hypothetical protein